MSLKHCNLNRMNTLLVLLLFTILCLEKGNRFEITICRCIMKKGILAGVISVNLASLLNDSVKILVVMIPECNHGRGAFMAI
jgi:hypothetical protein